MQRKIFIALMLIFGLLADIYLPLMWSLIASIPIIFVSWWIAYRSDWFA